MQWKHIILAAGALGLASANAGDAANPTSMSGAMGTMSGPMGAQASSGKHKGMRSTVPADLSGGFKPEEITLRISFKEGFDKGKKGKGKHGNSTMVTSMNGQSATTSGPQPSETKEGGKGKGKGKGNHEELTIQETEHEPKYALGKSNGTNAQSKWIIVMVDTTSESNRVLHYVHSDYQMMSNGSLQSTTQPQMAWMAPGKLGDTSGQRQYTFLMYTQTGAFSAQGMPPAGQSVNMSQFVQQNGLQKAVAGKAIAVDAAANSTGGASATGAGSPAQTMPAQSGSPSPAAANAGSSLRTQAYAVGVVSAVVAIGMAIL